MTMLWKFYSKLSCKHATSPKCWVTNYSNLHLYKINYDGKREHFDKKLKKLIKEYNRIDSNEFYVEGGKEFYDIKLIEKLEEEYLKKIKKITKYKLLDQDEIDEINRRSRSNVKRNTDNDTESNSESDNEIYKKGEEVLKLIFSTGENGDINY